MTIGKCMKRTSSSDFVKWNKYIEMTDEAELKSHSKSDQYMAQIAFLVNLIIELLCSVPVEKRKKYDDFLHTFKRKELLESTSELELPKPAEEIDERLTLKYQNTAKSKSFWFALTGAG